MRITSTCLAFEKIHPTHSVFTLKLCGPLNLWKSLIPYLNVFRGRDINNVGDQTFALRNDPWILSSGGFQIRDNLFCSLDLSVSNQPPVKVRLCLVLMNFENLTEGFPAAKERLPRV